MLRFSVGIKETLSFHDYRWSCSRSTTQKSFSATILLEDFTWPFSRFRKAQNVFQSSHVQLETKHMAPPGGATSKRLDSLVSYWWRHLKMPFVLSLAGCSNYRKYEKWLSSHRMKEVSIPDEQYHAPLKWPTMKVREKKGTLTENLSNLGKPKLECWKTDYIAKS